MLRAIPCSSIGLSINDGRIPKKRSLSISVGAFLKKGHYRDFRSKFILLLFSNQIYFAAIEIDNDPFFGNAPYFN